MEDVEAPSKAMMMEPIDEEGELDQICGTELGVFMFAEVGAGTAVPFVDAMPVEP